ncbi:MMPL family transporter [Streptomyces niveus]|uniref:Membrane transport protein MMPL domain-containing protein n=1 Tax=Streptomyces niveus TaxID=193462 RepID=A0A1U9QQR8_STRNV|nr:hypothetical protein BBN63_10445 [Streptomyces niveus]
MLRRIKSERAGPVESVAAGDSSLASAVDDGIKSDMKRAETTSPPLTVVILLAAGAGVVTGAAVIMAGVFSVFTTLSSVEYKMLGTGMAVAILIDATVVRGVLLPASLALPGDRAWTMPGRWWRSGRAGESGRRS